MATAAACRQFRSSSKHICLKHTDNVDAWFLHNSNALHRVPYSLEGLPISVLLLQARFCVFFIELGNPGP